MHTPFPESQPPAVSFPDPKPLRDNSSSSSFPKWIIAVVGLVIILSLGGFFLYQSSSTTDIEPTPTPFVSGIDALPEPSDTPIPTKSPAPTPSATPSSLERTSVSIEVQNGTGTTGDAAVAKAAIDKAGYTKVKTGNATTQTATTTTLSYSSDVPASVVLEVSKALEAVFGSVTPEAGLSGKMTVRVITGPKLGGAAATKTMSPTPTALPKASASPTAKPTVSPTPAQ